MIYYDRIHASEGIDVSKKSESNECNICHYLYLLNKELKFQWYVCKRCHNLVIMSMNLSRIAILTLKVVVISVLLAELAKLRQNT